MARPPPETTVLIRHAAELLHKIKTEVPPTQILLDPKTIKLTSTDPQIRNRVKDLMMKNVKFTPSTLSRNQQTYIPPPKQDEGQLTKPLLGYRLRDLKTDVLSKEMYSTPRPRPLRGVVATVFGARGFLGNQIVASLVQYGAQVICPVRKNNQEHPLCMHTIDFRGTKIFGDQGQILTIPYDPTIFEEVAKLVERSQVVFNCIGTHQYPRVNQSQTFGLEAVFANLPRNIARACMMRGVQRFIHTSHINANSSSSIPFFKYKGHGEEAVLEEFPNSIIIRPADMFGDWDSFTRLMNEVVKSSSFPVAANNTFLLEGNEYVECQPVWVADVARAMVRAAMREYTFGQTYQLPGPDRYKLIEVMRFVESICWLRPSHVRVYSPAEVKLRFDRPGREPQMSWIDLHLRESVVPRPGVKSWEDLEMEPKELTKIENVAGDFLAKQPYRDNATGFDEEHTDLSLPRTMGRSEAKVIVWPVVLALYFLYLGVALMFP